MENHGHSDGFDEPRGGVTRYRRELSMVLVITATIMIAEVVGGLLSNSLALLSDAAHMLTDILALLLSLLAFRFSTRPPTRKTTFGFRRLEIFAAQINGAFLVFLALFIFYEAYQRLLEPQPIRSLLMMIVAGVGLLANVASAMILHRSSEKNLSVKASFLHIMGDLLSSVGVVIGGAVIYFTGWYLIDPILGVMIGLVILKGAYSVVSETANVLLEAVPRHIDLEALIREVETMEGVEFFHDVHLWTISSGLYALSGHVLIKDQMVSESGRILEAIRSHLRDRYGVNHTTLQLECECESCESGFVCPLESA
ncbi:MAG: cation transporter [Deltaproteobacteria bacterium]|nr:cation transporter [Deltaproteobacteria bacterium]MBW2123609.1 cation transporter [Deltaproteobacteria bacterium]